MPHSALHIPALIRLKKELGEIYAAAVIRAFSLSLISVFIPLYLLKVGFTLNQSLLYLAVFYASLVVFSPLTAIISSKLGLKHTMAIGPILTIIYLLLLRSIGTIKLPIYPLALIGALGSMLYWIPMNSHFSKASDKKHRGEQLGFFKALPEMASIAAPLVGGFVISLAGFSPLFVIASVLLLLSVAPLFLSYEYKSHLKYKWSEVFSKKNLHWFNDFFIQGFIIVPIAIVFPIYIYNISNEFSVTGAAVSLMSSGIALCGILIGKASDKYGRRAVMRAGSILLAVILFGLVIISEPLMIYALSFFAGIGWAAVAIPLFAMFCDSLKPGTRTEFMGFRDVAYGLGRCLALLLLVAIPTFKFQTAFTIAALSSIYFSAAKI